MHTGTKEEKASFLLFIACWLVYAIITMTKINYSASIAFIVKEGIFTKSSSGLISAGFYLSYALAQILCGKLCDKISPFKIIAFAIAGSAVTNFILAFTNNFFCVIVLWSLTGVFQFGCWPCITKIISSMLIPEHRQKASFYITLSISIGGILSYIFANTFLEAFGWSGVFTLNVVVLLVIFVLWRFTEKRTKNILSFKPSEIKAEKRAMPTKTKFLPIFFSSGLFFILFLEVAQGMLDYGIKTWSPTMMMESYGLSATWASMQTAVLYVCNMLGLFLLIKIFKKIKNPVLLEGIYFLICLPACFLTLFIGKLPAFCIIFLLCVSTSITYSMNSLGVRISSFFNDFGYSGMVCALINAFVSIGIVIGNFGYGFLAERFGWSAVTLVWVCVCAAAIVFSIISVIFWNSFVKKYKL